MRIVELIIDENEKLSGIDAVSIVEFPAIESNFIALSEHLELAKVDDEKKILMGAALIPNKNIYRRNGNDEYYIFFSEDTVRKASELFLMNSNQNNATLEHEKKLKDLTVVESWIVEDVDMDKSKKYGLNAPVGTWMVSMKVNNDAIWNDFVKTGKVKGFSIEGYFSDKLEMSLNLNKKEMEKNVMIEKIKSLIEKSELKNQKVDLASIKILDIFIKDIKQNQKAAESQGAILGKSLGQAEMEKRKFQDIIKSMKSGAFLGAKNAVDEFLSKAKELGIDASGTPQIKEIEKLIASTKEYDAFEKSIGTIPQV
jgi:hypothetical protein